MNVQNLNKKSFVLYMNGESILFSYNTPILKRDRSGALRRLWNGWSMTTGKHIREFCGLNKSEFLKLEVVEG